MATYPIMALGEFMGRTNGTIEVVDIDSNRIIETYYESHPETHHEVLDDCNVMDFQIRGYKTVAFIEADCVRFCSVCGEPMFEGYYVEAHEYYCSDECLHKVYSEDEYTAMYEDDYAYWTQWY